MQSAWRWRGFAAWVAAAALLVFSVLAMASIGLFLLPLALVCCWLAARSSRDALDLLGALSGAGLVCLAIGALDGFEAVLWLGVGLALTLGGPVAFVILRCRDVHARLG
jgi:hypothetical protein